MCPPADWLASAQAHARSWRNAWGFKLRQRIGWQRQGYREKPEPKDNLYPSRDHADELVALETIYVEKYKLQSFRETSGRNRYLENLTFLQYLETLLPAEVTGQLPAAVSWLDVGAKNWSYAEALYRFAQSRFESAELTGVELDGYRLYPDFHSRHDYAMAYTKQLPHAHYHVGDVMDHQAKHDVISCFLPFIFPEPLLFWGLPLKYYQPMSFFQHLLSLLKPGGLLIVTNQGEVEYQEQADIFLALQTNIPNLSVEPLGQLPDSFLNYRYPRFGWRCQFVSQ